MQTQAAVANFERGGEGYVGALTYAINVDINLYVNADCSEDRGPCSFPIGWVIVAAGALMTCVGIGAMFSLAVFLQPMSAATGWSRAGISSAMTLDFLWSWGSRAFVWGALQRPLRHPHRRAGGAVLLGLGLVLASRATVADRSSSSCTAFWSASPPAPSSRR